MLMAERQSARMSKTTNDGLTRPGTGCFIASFSYLYGNSGRQRVNIGLLCVFFLVLRALSLFYFIIIIIVSIMFLLPCHGEIKIIT